MENFFNKFALKGEKEDLQTVIANIENSVVFRGTNLWILIFAIFVASLGLNINSTAVIIGAMLISPIMGPIMGIGLSMGISDVDLLRKAIYNYAIATGVALTTSTVFFLVSPLNEAHSEILARTSPTIYDTLIALFGGFAGIIAVSSKQKGNVIPGVAIATALMPPLCTAGYGVATLQLNYFLGAFYLFIINTVFIALATLIIVRLLHFPDKQLANQKANKLAHRITALIVVVTLLPSIYFGYDMVQQNRFLKSANDFINFEAHFTNDYLLNKKIDPKKKQISLVFGGEEIPPAEIKRLKEALPKYKLAGAELDIKQGFAYLSDTANEQVKNLSKALALTDDHERDLQKYKDSTERQTLLHQQIFSEIKAQYPFIHSAIIQPVAIITDSVQATQSMLIILTSTRPMPNSERQKLIKWLKIRLPENELKIIFDS